jgi:long-chain acyl-CoA synthetase
VVVCNAIHLAGPGADLPRLAGLLAPGGRLLIDDIFLDAPNGVGGDVRLDWLTHGGLSWPTERATVAGLAAAGLTVRRVVHVGRPANTLIVADAGSVGT